MVSIWVNSWWFGLLLVEVDSGIHVIQRAGIVIRPLAMKPEGLIYEVLCRV